MKRRTPLKRKTALQRAGKLSPVSQKRRIALREYDHRRLAFLDKHPFCQHFIAVHGLDEGWVIADAGWVVAVDGSHLFTVPHSTQIHHRRHREHARLNDEKFWMAVSAEGQRAIHADPKTSYARGWLL